MSTKMYTSGTLVDLQVTSPEPDYSMRDIYTWTPPLKGIDPSTLPVVYFLHGWPGSPSSMIAGVTASLLKDFQNGVRPFIAAFPDGNAKTHIDSEWANSSDGKAMIETWLTTNVITAVEGSRIRPKTERAIVGFSMGGYGAAMIALHHPNLYSQVTTLAGYFLVDDLTGAFKGSAKIAYQNPANFMGAAKDLRWYLAEAKDDYTIPIRGQMAAWSKKLTALKVPVTTSSPMGGHSFTFVANEALAFTKWFSWPAPTASSAPPSKPSTPATPAPPAPPAPLPPQTPEHLTPPAAAPSPTH
jgi:S-formylglutathione hydrolase FrmB